MKEKKLSSPVTNDSSVKIVLADDIAFDNFSELHELLVAAFAFMHDRIDPPSSMNQLTVEGLREKAGHEALILAFCDTQLIGCAFAKPKTTSGVYYVGKVAVRTGCRGLGVGGKLLERAAQLALSNACCELELEIRVELVENHRFFERHGFIKFGENSHLGYERPTSFTYRRRLIE